MPKSIKPSNNIYIDSSGIVHNHELLSTLLQKIIDQFSDGIVLESVTNLNDFLVNQKNSSLAFGKFEQQATGTPETTATGLLISYRDDVNWGSQLALFNGQLSRRGKRNGSWSSWTSI